MEKSKSINLKSPIEIGILEIRRHPPILYTFSKICKTKNTNVTIFTTKEILSRVETHLKNTENYNIILKKDYESYISYLKRVENICNQKIDILFINTIHETVFDLTCYLKFNPNSKTILLVHHANAWLKPRLVFNIKHILRTIDTNISSILISKFIFPKFDAINVIYHPLRNYILTNTDYKKEIFTLPTSTFEGTKITSTKTKDTSKLRVVLPGGIQEHRRDYAPVVSSFQNIFKHYNENIILHVLGTPVGKYGRTIYNEFKKMKDKGHNVVIYDEFVPDDTFDEVLVQSDIILSPTRIKTRADNEIQEEYGVSVGSGIVFNAILYAKPIIVPAEFNMLGELNSSTLRYSNPKELEDVIAELLTHPEKLEKLRKESLNNAKKMSLEKLQDYFESTVLGWLLN
jgi:glycosyltransferase involved in cell wall biosynthesis